MTNNNRLKHLALNLNLLSGFVKTTLILMFLIFSSGCYLSASLKSLNKTIQNSIGLTRAQPDLTDGQRITTGNGYQVEGSFSEMSEDKALTNGYSIEGVFYE